MGGFFYFSVKRLFVFLIFVRYFIDWVLIFVFGLVYWLGIKIEFIFGVYWIIS